MGSIEEIAYMKNFMTKGKLLDIAKRFNNEYFVISDAVMYLIGKRLIY